MTVHLDGRAVLPAELAEPVARDLCTDCGISRSSDPKACGRACQFIKPDYDGLETQVHGRTRDPSRPDEMHFGPFRRMLRASPSGCSRRARSMPS